MDFVLHPALAADTVTLCDWPLSRVLLMKDARFPWLILVPRIAGLAEIFELDEAGRQLLMAECCRAGEGLKRLTGAKKINIGALGNLVPQLHLHVVARNEGEAAWPGPVWGRGTALAYAPEALAALRESLVNAL